MPDGIDWMSNTRSRRAGSLTGGGFQGFDTPIFSVFAIFIANKNKEMKFISHLNIAKLLPLLPQTLETLAGGGFQLTGSRITHPVTLSLTYRIHLGG